LKKRGNGKDQRKKAKIGEEQRVHPPKSQSGPTPAGWQPQMRQKNKIKFRNFAATTREPYQEALGGLWVE
jgi:hypothetical protein